MSSRPTKKSKNLDIKATISNDVPDYGNDPTVVKRGAESKAFLEKYGFPEMLLKKRYAQCPSK